jgi:hypothetical protein
MSRAIATGFIASSDYIPVYGRSVLDEDAVELLGHGIGGRSR